MSTTIVRTRLDDGVTVAAGQTDHGWVILLSDRVTEDSTEEHVALASARRAIAGWEVGFRPAEGGVDCIDLMPRMPGTIGPRPRPCATIASMAASALAPLTALAAMVAYFQTDLLGALIS